MIIETVTDEQLSSTQSEVRLRALQTLVRNTRILFPTVDQSEVEARFGLSKPQS
jgi:hypothetical protein